MKLRLTRIGVYVYTKRRTVSFTWKCRWFWKPSLFRMHPGFMLHWGWWMLENFVFDEDDDWGEQKAEDLGAILLHALDSEALATGEGE